jgi:DNA-binding NarL/FixJ family response regulator
MRARSRAAGAHAYLCKPVDADVLLGAIRNAMGTDSPAATAPSA